MMAKPNQDILVKELVSGSIHVYVDNPEKEVEDIKAIEGVSNALIVSGPPIFVRIDPRYNQNQVAQEIREFLAGEIPDIFREEG